MLTPSVIFLVGITILALFIWYFGSDSDERKRVVGTVLTILTTAFCVYAVVVAGIKRGIDLEGGSQFIVEIKPAEGKPVTDSAREEAKGVLLKRLDRYGGDANITNQGDRFLNIQMPGVSADSRAEVRQSIEKIAKLELRLVHPNSDGLAGAVKQGEASQPGYVVLPVRADKIEGEGRTDYLVSAIPDLEGDRVSSAFPVLDVSYKIAVRLDGEGGDIMREITGANVGRKLAIVLDGEVISAPVIQGRFGERFEITGDYKYEEANALSSVLENPLANPLEIQDERSVDAEMGADTIKQGIMAGLAGLGVTLLFVVLYYRLAGIIALIGLAVNICLLFGSMAIFGFTLTMPGIAGILLTIGMAVDANVLIFERLREEMKAGKSLPAAIESAYEKAFSAIFDANVTTLITSIILFAVASSIIKGFAITLTLGILASMFAALLVTRICFSWGTSSGLIKRISLTHIIPEKSYDILGKRRFTTVLSVLLVGSAIVIIPMVGKRGVDFKGGNLVSLQVPDDADTSKKVSTDRIEEILKGIPYQTKGEDGKMVDKTIQEVVAQSQDSVTNPGERYISIKTDFGSGDAVEAKLIEEYGKDAFKISVEKVGPVIGKQLLQSSAWALGLGLLGILLYVTFRFEFSFALGAIVALFHDLLITAGMVALTGREFSLVLVGAFLTIAGYSINDTIVVFDRIRETLRLKKGDIGKIMNEAISATLSRTILTSLTTLITIGTLYYFGGPDLRDFSFTIIVGVLIGTYSSIFVASPIVYWWAKTTKKSLRREVLDADQERQGRDQTAAPA